MKGNHICHENLLKAECPICLEDMMYSILPSVILPNCGHSIHERCFKELCKTNYKCPLCFKSIGDMSEAYSSLDQVITANPMPNEYADKKVKILCNDCNKYSILYTLGKMKCF